jgi:hypothetical protein
MIKVGGCNEQHLVKPFKKRMDEGFDVIGIILELN